MEDKLTITINIGERQYPISIKRGDSEREELIRKAADLINDSLINYKKKAYKNKDDQDYLAMTAIKFAVSSLENENKEEISPLVKELKILNYNVQEAIEK